MDDEIDVEWLDRAECRDLPLDVAFQPIGHQPHPDLVAACERCPVKTECLEHALRRPITHGYVAGLSASERRALT